MSAAATNPVWLRPPCRYDNAAEWVHALGDIPLERIIFDPWPGTATEADLLRLVERDKRLCELIDGTLVEKPVGFWEGIVASDLIAALVACARKANAGVVSSPDATMRMKSGRVRLPDVGFISRERLARLAVPGKAIQPFAPDLAVEIVSESNAPAEMAQKLREYFESGTRLAWIIDPAHRSVAVYRAPGEPARTLDQAATLDGEDVLPGFSMPVADLFRNLPAPS